jgi:sirohydrochlorin cobaltochelatase
MSTAPKAAILLVGLRSSESNSDSEFVSLLEHLRTVFPAKLCAVGFLESASPALTASLAELVQQGAGEITVLPGMLLATGEIQKAILSLFKRFQAEYPDIKLSRGEALGVHAKWLRAARERIESCEAELGSGYDRKHTLLLVAAQGTTDPEANAVVSKITRLLWEGMGFGWAETCYSEATLPRVSEGLAQSQRLGFRQIVLFPWSLFNQGLIGRIHAAAATYQALNHQVRMVKVPPVGIHPLVLEAFVERVQQAENGTGNMNCQFCRYREKSVAPAQHYHDRKHA